MLELSVADTLDRPDTDSDAVEGVGVGTGLGCAGVGKTPRVFCALGVAEGRASCRCCGAGVGFVVAAA